MAENCGLTLLDLKKRFEYSSVTTTSGESFDDLETPAVNAILKACRVKWGTSSTTAPHRTTAKQNNGVKQII